MVVDCEAEFDEFLERMDLLHEKWGPLLFQFPRFSKDEMQACALTVRASDTTVGLERSGLPNRSNFRVPHGPGVQTRVRLVTFLLAVK
jgi:uncharacterized protein YecE (DUF72 family)